MLKDSNNINELLSTTCIDTNFSGVILLKKANDNFIESAFGFSNRADELENTITTKFGIASGCKLFTAIAICQLAEKGLLKFDTKLKNCLDIEFPHFDENITIHHLLTHSSGVPDYFDETVMDDFEDLWKERPMYRVNSLKDFLPMFQPNKMMFKPGERFHYNNAGFILLGLIVEHISGLGFTDYVEANIFKPCGMEGSGYFSFDNLPKNTATGYIDNPNGTWRSNIYSLPIKGGSDGGAYVTAPDMANFWEHLMNNRLLNEDYKQKLLTPHIQVKEEEFYGYGVWISTRKGDTYKYHVMGYDPGVSFKSACYPASGLKLVILSNKSSGPYEISKVIEENL